MLCLPQKAMPTDIFVSRRHCLTNISVSGYHAAVIPMALEAVRILVWMNHLGIPTDNSNSIKGFDLQVPWRVFLADRKINHQAVLCTRSMSSLHYGTHYWEPQRWLCDHGILSKAQQLLGSHRIHLTTWGKIIFDSRLENFKMRALLLKLCRKE